VYCEVVGFQSWLFVTRFECMVSKPARY
jgi:hypothetical protein